MTEINKELKQSEIDNNYEAFKEILGELMEGHKGEYALMKNRKIVTYFSTFLDAEKAGYLLDKDGLFSVQKVDNSIENLGVFSYA